MTNLYHSKEERVLPNQSSQDPETLLEGTEVQMSTNVPASPQTSSDTTEKQKKAAANKMKAAKKVTRSPATITAEKKA